MCASEERLEGERWKGHDPYDVLRSPLFDLPVLRSNRLVRFGSQQVFRRLPVDLRPLLRVPADLNPVTLGLYVQGIGHRVSAGLRVEDARAKCEVALRLLEQAQTAGWSGACWGYPFPWEARYASIPAGFPTIVATSMITNGLHVAHQRLGLPSAKALILSAVDFVLHDLNRSNGNDGAFCWSYSPGDHQRVINATAKGARLVAQAVALGAPPDLLEAAERSVRFVVAAQESSGRWPYAIGDTRSFADVFHTGYVLDSLREYRALTGDRSPTEAIDRGYAYFRERFFEPDMTVRYYDDRTLPIDATAAAQAVITLCEFGDVDAAGRVAERAVEVLGLDDGAVAYRRQRRYLDRTHYLRWSTAWMYAALARLQEARSDPVAGGFR